MNYQTLIYWQEQQAAAHFMLQLARQHGDSEDILIFWQAQAAWAYACLQSNRGF